AAAGADRWSRPQPAVAGLWPDRASTDAVHGLRGLLGGLRLRHRRLAWRPAGRGLGALVAAVDHRCMGVPWCRYHLGFVVGLLRTGLGWLVVLGPGGKRLVHALAGGH